STSFSIASEALNPATKGRTALDRAGRDLESGRRLMISGCLVSYRASCLMKRTARRLFCARPGDGTDGKADEGTTRKSQEKTTCVIPVKFGLAKPSAMIRRARRRHRLCSIC